MGDATIHRRRPLNIRTNGNCVSSKKQSSIVEGRDTRAGQAKPKQTAGAGKVKQEESRVVKTQTPTQQTNLLLFFFKTKRIENPFRFFYPFAHNLPTANRSMNLFSPICRRGLGCYFRPISHLPPVQPATTPAFTRKHFFFKLKNKIPGLGFRQDRVICGHFVEKMF